MRSFRKLVAILLAGLMLTGALPAFAQDTEEGAEKPTEGSDIKPGGYYSYISQYEGASEPLVEASVKGSAYQLDDGANVTVRDYEGKKDVLYWDSQQGGVEWKITVPESGLYNIGISYCPIVSKASDIQLSLSIDGRIPFSEVELFKLQRIYKNDTNEFRTDKRGNHLRPKQVEVLRWRLVPVTDSEGRHNDPFKFYLEAGEHTIRLDLISEALAIEEIRLYQVPVQKPYIEPVNNAPVEGVLEIFQAEFTYEKSHATLYPTEDRGNPAAQPAHPYLVRYNTVGKTTYRLPGQWISWEFEVPEDGYYHIAFKVRQNVNRSMYSTRRVYIDGEVPFDELNNVKFPYSIHWYNQFLGGDTPYLFYLEKGRHEIRMEIVTGDLAEALSELEDIIYELNTWYRKIIMITGSNPDASRSIIDVNRDYLLDKKIPGLMKAFADIADRLEKNKAIIDEFSMDRGNTASFINQIVAQLRSFVKEPETIPLRLDSYKSNISTLSTAVLDMREQPLEIDYFALVSPDMVKKLPRAAAGFFQTLSFRFRMFISSFTQDYSSVGEVYEENPIDVWVSTSDIAMTGISSGRDQAQILKSLVDDLFVPEKGIGVNLSLVNSSEALIQAVLANKGPDVALFITKETPVNLAIRGALVDLSQFEDFPEVAKRFHESALIPYYFDGKCYALPETQNYDVMFYRKDIFEEMGLSVPTTWEEFYEIAARLYINNMMIGIPESQRTFEMLLFQNGGTFYNEKLTKTAFDTPEALKAFKQWTELYSKHGLPLVFDFFSRFRTGEMPLAIMPYTQANYLNAAAPEIKNLWEMVPVPGVVGEDGTINNAVTSYGTGAIAIKGDKERESYEFIKWWTSSEVQARFGNELEQLMGPAARYPTANVEAFDMLPWDRAQAEYLKQQWENVTDVPQVPGNYYIQRNISFAFRAVVINYANVRETLNKYNKEINKEIRRKRIEFGLETD